jgi:A nuclease family of the HNH/ENDO VII superfamily with conserved AHH
MAAYEFNQHHLIPKILQENDVLRKIGFNLNDARNLLDLPTTNSNLGFALHDGKHPKSYYQNIEEIINRIGTDNDIFEGSNPTAGNIAAAQDEVDKLMAWLKDGAVFGDRGGGQMRPLYALNSKDAFSNGSKLNVDVYNNNNLTVENFRSSRVYNEVNYRNAVKSGGAFFDARNGVTWGNRADLAEGPLAGRDPAWRAALNSGGSGTQKKKIAGLLKDFTDDASGKVSPFNAILFSLAAIAVLKIASDNGQDIVQYLADLELEFDIKFDAEMIQNAAEGLFVGLTQYGVLALLTGGAGPAIKMGLEAYSNFDDIKTVVQLLDVAFPEWELIATINRVIDTAEKIVERALNYIKEEFLADTIIIADGDRKIEGGDGTQFLWGRGASKLLGGDGNDYMLHSGSGVAQGEAGDDTVIGWGGENLTLDGGEGNDWVVAFLGTKTTTIGGLGRDWIWNTSEGGVLYGDTFNGLDENGNPVNYDDPANSDNFWWWPDTTIMDAQKNDVLKFFGMPLTGGAEGIPIVVSGLAGFLGGGIGDLAAAAAREALGPKYFMDGRLFFDNFAVFMNYIFKQDKYGNLGLYVANAFNGLASLFGNHDFSQTGDGTSLRGAMKVANFDVPVSYWGAAIAQAPRGTLGMKFLLANPALAALALLPPIAGLSGAMFETIHKVIALADAAERFAKAMRWSNPRPGDNDPLVLDLDGDGIELISIATAGVRFDDNNNYFSEETGWLKGDDGFLVLDGNHNGRIDDGSEMFGGFGQTANDNVWAVTRVGIAKAA